jgi:hypothetical protein
MWKSLVLLFGLAALPLGAQAAVEVRGLGRDWTDFGPPGGTCLSLRLDSGGVAILPSEDQHVRVRYVGRREQDLSRVRLRFEPSGRHPELRVSHTPSEDFEFEIQVPRATGLDLRMSAGEVTIRGIEGDKDLRLHAGEITVHVGDPEAYGEVAASVWAGEVNPGPFGGSKGGLFRSFRREGQGRYSLQAKVKAGEVNFEK